LAALPAYADSNSDIDPNDAFEKDDEEDMFNLSEELLGTRTANLPDIVAPDLGSGNLDPEQILLNPEALFQDVTENFGPKPALAGSSKNPAAMSGSGESDIEKQTMTVDDYKALTRRLRHRRGKPLLTSLTPMPNPSSSPYPLGFTRLARPRLRELTPFAPFF